MTDSVKSWPWPWRIGAVLYTVVYMAFLALMLKPVEISQMYTRSWLELHGMNRATMLSDTDYTLSYFEGGEGPTVVLIHGLQDSAGTWYQNVGWLTDHFHVLAVELPGHGQSGPKWGEIEYDASFRAIEQLLDERAPEGQKVTLIGNSLGGYVAMVYALERPDRVQHVISVNGAGMPMVSHRDVFMPHTTKQMRDTARKVVGRDLPYAPEILWQSILRSISRGPTESMWKSIESSPSLETRLPELKMRVDVIWGEDDGMIPLSDGQQMAALTSGTLHTIPDCGHSPQVMCPSKFNSVLQKILLPAR